jgi:hypothetical protein
MIAAAAKAVGLEVGFEFASRTYGATVKKVKGKLPRL